MGHYLTISKWRPFFRPDENEILSTLVWVRFPALPVECFKENLLLAISNTIGKTVNVDLTTHDAAHGKYARACVEINLAKPLLPSVTLYGRRQTVKYEGLHQICFKCGRYDHHSKACSEIPEAPVNGDHRDPTTTPTPTESIYMPWMLPNRGRRRPIYKAQDHSRPPGGRTTRHQDFPPPTTRNPVVDVTSHAPPTHPTAAAPLSNPSTYSHPWGPRVPDFLSWLTWTRTPMGWSKWKYSKRSSNKRITWSPKNGLAQIGKGGSPRVAQSEPTQLKAQEGGSGKARGSYNPDPSASRSKVIVDTPPSPPRAPALHAASPLSGSSASPTNRGPKPASGRPPYAASASHPPPPLEDQTSAMESEQEPLGSATCPMRTRMGASAPAASSS